jgi:hypothetical protein
MRSGMVIWWLFLSLLVLQIESRVETSFLIIHQEESLSTVCLYFAQTLRQLRSFLDSDTTEVLILTSNHDMSEATLRGFLGEKVAEGSLRLFFEPQNGMFSSNFCCFCCFINFVEMGTPPASKFNMLASYSKGDVVVFLNLRTVPHITADLPLLLEKALGLLSLVGCLYSSLFVFVSFCFWPIMCLLIYVDPEVGVVGCKVLDANDVCIHCYFL